MDVISIAKNQVLLNNWQIKRDLSIIFVNWCYREAGTNIGDYSNATEAYDNALKIGKKVYRDRLKPGDICFFKNEDQCIVSLFLRDGGNEEKCICIEAFINDSKDVQVRERSMKYIDCIFIRPETGEEKPKSKKK
jgi:hypothetical protein